MLTIKTSDDGNEVLDDMAKNSFKIKTLISVNIDNDHEHF